MSMYDWAKREVKIAKQIEKDDTAEGEFDYGGACYDSALRAFKSLTKDGHSGFSIGLTKNILIRLIEGKPLTPIEDTDDIWNDVSSYDPERGYTNYQCKRMGSLFKKVYTDGTVKYNDIDASYCINLDTKETYHSHLAQKIVDELFPITMPYSSRTRALRVGCVEFLTDLRNGDFDTVGVMHILKSDDTKIDINRFFKEGADHKWIEIGVEEYDERYSMKIERTDIRGKK